MNKMLTPNGGVPLKLTDIAYMQDAIRNAFEGLLNGLGKNGNVRVAGCVLSDSVASSGNRKVTWTAGWIALHGEIFVVPSGTIDSVPNEMALWWKIVRVDEAIVTLENGEKAAKRQRSYAVLVSEDAKDELSVADETLRNLSDSINAQTRKQFETYFSRPTPNMMLPRLTVINYPDGSRTVELIGGATENVQLQDGELSRYQGYLSFEGLGIIGDSAKDRLSTCVIRGYDNVITIFNPDGTRLQTMPVGVIKLVIRD